MESDVYSNFYLVLVHLEYMVQKFRHFSFIRLGIVDYSIINRTFTWNRVAKHQVAMTSTTNVANILTTKCFKNNIKYNFQSYGMFVFSVMDYHWKVPFFVDTRSHAPKTVILSLYMNYQRIVNMINTTDAPNGSETTYPSEVSQSTASL